MRRLPLAALLALVPIAAPVPACAQAVAAEAPPSGGALALARQLGPIGWGMAGSGIDDVTASLTNRLLQTQLVSRGAGCEPADPRCRAVAQRLAREAAPAQYAAFREVRIKLLAYIIDDQLRPDEIAAAQATAGTPGGIAMAQLFAAVSDPARLTPAFSRRAQALMAEVPNDTALYERFYDATKDLPRSQRRIPPPPMPTRKTP